MLERRQKDKLLALIDMPQKKLLEETAKVGKALCKFKTTNISQHKKGLKSESSKDKDKEVSNVGHQQTLERKYSIRVKTSGVVIKEVKQRIIAITTRVRRYHERVDRFRQNRFFQNNQKQFYRELNQEGERCDDDKPDAEESKKFCGRHME